MCPFHEERTPSLSLSFKKNCFHCFGCGVSGNLNFLKNYNYNISFSKENKILNLKNIDFFKKNKNKIIKLNNFINKIFFFNNKKEKNIFFKNRRIKKKIIKKFELGYSEYNLLNYIKYNYFKKILLNTGVFNITKKNKIYNIFNKRIIFPIKNRYGVIIGYSGRNISNKKPKYINSYNNFFFKKKKTLYGIYETSKYIIKFNYVILVEGYMDVISLYQEGFKNVLGLMGTNITIYQIKKILNLTKNLFICFDNDKSGILSLKKSIFFFLNIKLKLNIKYIILKKNFDPDEFLKKFGKNKFNERIENAVNIYNVIYILYIKNLFYKNIKLNLYKLKKFLKNINNLKSIENIFYLFIKNKNFNFHHFFYIIDFLYNNKFKYTYKVENNIYEKIIVVFLILPQIIYFFDKESLKKIMNYNSNYIYLFSDILKFMKNKLNFLNFFLKNKNYKSYIICKSIFNIFFKKKLRIIFKVKKIFIKFIKKLSKKENIFYKKNILKLCDILYNIFDLYE